MDVNDVMTPNPVTAQVEATVAEAFNLLQSMDVRHLPVMEGRRLVGIVSDRDLSGVALATARGEPEGELGRTHLDRPLAELMSSDVLSVSLEEDVGEVIDLMIEQKIGAIPVLDAESRLVGIVSYVDLLREMRDLI